MNTEDHQSPQNEEEPQKEDSEVGGSLKESPQEDNSTEDNSIEEDTKVEELEEEEPSEEEAPEEEILVDDSLQENLQKGDFPEENPDSSTIEAPISEFPNGEMVPMSESDVKNELLEFSELDLDNFTDQDLLDMEEAISENLFDEDELVGTAEGEMDAVSEIPAPAFEPDIDDDLEAKMQAEIKKKKKELGIKSVTKEAFIQNLSKRRNKIVYHALWHLTFNMEDHEATKQTLYEALKDVTSKNPVEPLDEHKFYFGLGFILRLQLYEDKVIHFKKGKLKLMVSYEHLQELLNMVGDPISDRPILTKTEKKTMFSDFLKDDFLDI
ncbi:MAG: hypothetical protein ACTSRK_11235 [Promethearchaeota archaeon]